MRRTTVVSEPLLFVLATTNGEAEVPGVRPPHRFQSLEVPTPQAYFMGNEHFELATRYRSSTPATQPMRCLGL